MKKNGFTLIELLAVIVILAIIALIATPAVLNIIEDSRKSTAEASARNIINSAKTYYMSETMNGRTVGTIDLSGTTLKYDGDQASKGTITFTDGKASGKMYVGGYCVEVAVDGKVESEKMDEDECEIETPVIEPEVYKYADGTAVYFNPVTGKKCDSSESVSTTGTKDGCMKWYAFLTDENSETVNLILDHNTTKKVDWTTSQQYETPTVVNAQLQADITNWNDAVKSTARLISASEVNQIAPVAEGFTWTETDRNTRYYLHTGNSTSYGEWNNPVEAGTNKYAWLFDNTYNCTKYGCNVDDSSVHGYWTSSYSGTKGLAWYVGWTGMFMTVNCYGGSDSYGVRPVITVPKSIFEQ